jgi:hypothetical protein
VVKNLDNYQKMRKKGNDLTLALRDKTNQVKQLK